MSDHLSDFLAQFLRRSHPGLPTPPDDPEARDRTVAAMEAVLRQRRREQRSRKLAFGGMGVAGALAAGVAFVVWSSGEERDFVAEAAVAARFERPDASGAASTGSVPEGWHWRPGDVVQTAPHGEATFLFKDGSTVALAEQTRARFERRGALRRFELERGALMARVQPLGLEVKFEVLTDEVSVVVHGTHFSVEKLPEAPCPERPATRVRVTEGEVQVTHEGEAHLLRAGATWPPECPEPPPAPAPTPAPPVIRPPIERSRPEAATPSVLEVQNRLFAEAVSHERAGNLEQAVDSLDRLLRQYPRGPLAESAEVARLKLLGKTSPERARQAAREYLERFPGGYGRDEARRILDEGETP